MKVLAEVLQGLISAGLLVATVATIIGMPVFITAAIYKILGVG